MIQPARKAAQKRAIARTEMNGPIALVVVDDARMGSMQELDLSIWIQIGPIASVIIEGFRRICCTTSQSTTRRGWMGDLKSGFHSFCSELMASKKRQLTPTDLSSETISQFVDWLRTRVTTEGRALATSTKCHYLKAINNVVDAVRGDLQRDGIVCEFPKSPFSSEHGPRVLKTEPLDQDKYKEVFRFIAEHALATITEVSPLLEAVLEIRKRGRTSEIAEVKSQALCCAYVLDRYDGHFPERKSLDDEVRGLVDLYGYTETRRAVFPQANDVIPLLLLLACFTGFNQQPLTSLATDDIRRVMLFGTERVAISPPKFRARGNLQRRSFPRTGEALGPPEVLDFLVRWTSPLREIARQEIRDQIFLYASKWKKADEEYVRSLGEPINGRFTTVARAIYNFLKPRFPKYIGTRLLRASFAEQMNILTNGDLEAIGVLLGHSSIAVTAGLYRSSEASRRDELALAGAMAMRERLVSSLGKVDGRPLSPSADRTAATPGFECLDPLLSPVAGQTEGRLCTAYGQCPGCPLGFSCRNRAVALARAIQLRERMDEAKDELGAIAFDRAFGVAYSGLVNRHIPNLASPEVIAKARKLTLNPLPRLV